MKKLFLLIVIISSFITVSLAQRRQTLNSKVLVNTNKPAVFISFIRSKKIVSDGIKNEEKYLFFRITNNSRWNIWLNMGGVSRKELGDARLFYAIEDEKSSTIRSGSTGCHVCSVNPLAPGRSIIFSLPTSATTDDALMRIAYSFDWERDNESQSGSYSTHSVEFYFSSLPKPVLFEMV